MKKTTQFGAFLYLTTALTLPAMAQQSPGADEADVQAQAPEISIPGGDTIVVTGQRDIAPERTSSQVLSVLTSEALERTGDGDVASALERVTGLSVGESGAVNVRGLGDRYSLALLNGSPLPSPEPLKRSVPLDLFPTGILSSVVVQKSYSPNYPGEFGGGVINLTTPTLPEKNFVSTKVSITYDTESTGRAGYSYPGGGRDFLGYDDGTRSITAPLGAALATGRVISVDTLSPNLPFAERSAELAAITSSLSDPATILLEQRRSLPPNLSLGLNLGRIFDVGDNSYGILANFGFKNGWTNRNAIQQASLDAGLSSLVTDGRTAITDNKVVVNGLVSLGAALGDHKIRLTNLYVHDTVKRARLANYVSNSSTTQNVVSQKTAWYERQLIDSQLVGEFDFDALNVDVRLSYANSKRRAPYERTFNYIVDPATGVLVNNLSQQGGAWVSFSRLNENVYGAGADLSYDAETAMPVRLTAGYAFTDTRRLSTRRDFRYAPEVASLPRAVAEERPDLLVSATNVENFDIYLRETTGVDGAGAYHAGLRIHAAYGMVNIEPVTDVEVSLGARYESARQSVTPLGLDLAPTTRFAPTILEKADVLPALTVTWKLPREMQLRANLSRTLARPQFRELAQQPYQDIDFDRQFIGNPFLTNSRLTNAELRYEYYFAPREHVSIAGFYKSIDNPIESFSFYNNGIVSSFANAPSARLWGGEVELEKHYPVFASRNLIASINYTYTQSALRVGANDMVQSPVFDGVASGLFRDGAPLTGQSDHLINLQFGLADEESLSQQTLLLRYASARVISRGLRAGQALQPDIMERPGIMLDVVLNQGVTFWGRTWQASFEARNLLRTRHQEFQTSGANRVDINNYRLGTTFTLGMGTSF